MSDEQVAADAKIATGVMFAHIPASLFLWAFEFFSTPGFGSNGLQDAGMIAILLALAFASGVVAVIASGFGKGRRSAAVAAVIVFGFAGVVCAIGFVNNLIWLSGGFHSPHLLVGWGVFAFSCLGLTIYCIAWLITHRTHSI